jgi:hypothetical protein
MAFRVKNLMIHVLPDKGEGSPPQQAPAQGDFCFFSCRQLLSLPPPPSPHCPPQQGPHSPACAPTPLPPIFDPTTLSTIKAQLQEAVKAVEEQEKLINEPTNISTLEEAQALENHLTAALEEVRLKKQELQNKAAGEQGPTS